MRYIGTLWLIFLMLICFSAAVGYGEELNSKKDIAMLYLKDTTLTVSGASKILSDESKTKSPVAFSAWTQKDEQGLSNTEFNKNTKADVVYIFGDSSLVLESSVPLKADDKSGCLLSEDTAYALFGSLNVKDSKLLLEGRELTVRGLLVNAKETVVVQAIESTLKDKSTIAESSSEKPQNSNVEEVSFKALAMDTAGADKLSQDKMVSSFTERNGIIVNALDFEVFKVWTHLLDLMLPIIITVLVMASLIKKAGTVKNKPIKCIFYLGTAIIMLLISLYICNIILVIPENMIPNHWSDFDFWQKWFQDYFKQVQQITYILKQKPEQSYLTPMLKSTGFSSLAVLLFCVSGIKLKVDTFTKLYGFLCLSIILEYIAIILLNNFASISANLPMVWLLYPYFLVGKYLVGLRKNEQCLLCS